MSEKCEDMTEAARLEALWSGQFGDDYIERNRSVDGVRGSFWRGVHAAYPFRSALEVGCNIGGNLRWVSDIIGPTNTHGIDISRNALVELRRRLPGIKTAWASARELPFDDSAFDLVFTMGVLIHQPDSTLPSVMSEIVRCSRHYVLCGEYFAEATEEVPYREQRGALFKRNYGALYERGFRELRLKTRGFLGRDQGWDDVTYWLFEKVASI